jgi:chromosome segregation ATPase
VFPYSAQYTQDAVQVFKLKMSRRQEEEQYWVMSQQLRKLEQMFDLQQGEHAQVLAVTEQLQSRIELLNSDNARLKAELAEQVARNLELAAQLSPMQESLERKDSHMKQVMLEYEQAILSNSKAVGEQKFLQDQILKLTEEQQQLYDDYEAALTRLESEANSATALMGSLEESRAENTQLRRTLEAKDHACEGHCSKLESVAHKYEKAVKEINAFKYSRAELVAKLAAADEEHSRLLVLADKAEQTAEEQRRTIAQLQHTLEGLQRDLQQATAAAKSAEEWQRSAMEQEAEMASKQLNLDELDMQLIETKSSLSRTQTELESAYCANQSILEDNAQLQHILKATQQEADAANAACEELRRQRKEWRRKDEELRKYFERKERVMALRAQAERELVIS